MPRKRQQPGHIYSVFVFRRTGIALVYFGSSEFTARQALASAIMSNQDAYAVEVRRDLQPWIRVEIKRT